MKTKLFSAIAATMLVASMQAAESVDMKSLSGSEIYSATIGGEPKDGVLGEVSVALPKYKSAVIFASPQKSFDGINQLQPWYATDISKVFTQDHNLTDIASLKKPQNQVFFLALELEDGGYLAIQPISALEVTNWIEVRGATDIAVMCGNMGTGAVKSAKTPMFAYAKGGDLYQVLSDLWSDVLANDQVKGRTTWRDEKEYPEAFKYLGWCSWEQYRKHIDEALLVGAVDELEKSSVPVRWVLVDDGHQTRDKSGALMNFEISTTRFPNGWAPLLAKRSDKIKWFGLWHCMFGEWKAISKENTMSDLDGYLIPHNNDRALIVGDDPKVAPLFYNKLVGSVANPGFDFTKIDVQTRDFTNYIGKVDNAVVTKRQNAEALEAECKDQLNGLINCMAQNLPCIFNTRYSAVTRVSVDYKLNNIPLAISHIYQSFQNTAWMSQTVWPDHDMFHSSDEKLGRFMAVSKAMSGAPIYLSDAPADMLAELINPLVYADGELLRPLAPGAPLPESFFANALLSQDVYRVIAPTSATSAAIVAYNISSDYVDGMKCSVSADDYRAADAMVQPYTGLREIPKEGLVYYDWYEKCGGVLKGEFEFELASVSDKLILLSQIENGWSVVGLEDKYLSGIAVESVVATNKSVEIEMHEAGTIVVYSSKKIKRASAGRVESMGGDLYRVVDAPKSVTLYR
ncbi:MAG: Sip1-related alpha-galactosidase [Rikenellaceae bacterium]